MYVPPNLRNSNQKLWTIENNMVLSWLVNSMTNEIGENFLLYSMTYEIWDDAKRILFNKKIFR